MGYKYLVLGMHMGEAIAHNLLQQTDTELVTIADRDRNVLKLGKRLEQSSSAECEYIISDIERMDLVKLFRDFDVVISALPARLSPNLLKAAIEAGTGFCELGGVMDATWACLGESKAAHRVGTSNVIDCGVQPGLGMILARKLMVDNPSLTEIGIYVGGMPQKPKPPIFHQNMFSIEGLRHLCFDPVPILENDQIVYKDALSELERLQISGLRKYSKRFEGRIEAFLSAGASISPWTFGQQGVKIFEKTLRWPGFVDFVKKIRNAEKFEEMIMPHISVPVDRNNPDFLFMRVVGKGERGAAPCFELLDEYDVSTGLSAMQRTTGFTTAVIARWIALGKIAVGVAPPENAISDELTNEFLGELGHYFDIKLRY